MSGRLLFSTGCFGLIGSALLLCATGHAQTEPRPQRIHPEDWFRDSPYWAGFGEDFIFVKLSVAVDATGTVTKCEAEVSTGSTRLAEAVCFLTRLNARYEPAKDQGGNPIAADDALQFRILPVSPRSIRYPASATRAFQQGTVVMTLDVGPDGKVKRCSIKQHTVSISLEQASCDIQKMMFRSIPPQDSLGHYIAFQTEKKMTWKLPDY